jgi:hypothetical protein
LIKGAVTYTNGVCSLHPTDLVLPSVFLIAHHLLQ